MQSNYEPLGDFIKEVKTRNSDLGAKELLGINIDKFFMPSVANIVGVDLSKYKVVKQNQFACNRMHVGRDGRIPVALSQRVAPFMVSPAYDVFEIKDPAKLLPEYLMMWFSRREFDRNAWFYTDGDVRGGLAWKAFCNMKLPVPSPEKQREIVAEYHTIQNRITLNNQLILTLETTAQAIYKQWFVEFEFPNEAGQPYKSSGGELVDSELGEIPKGWEVKQVADFVKCNSSNLSARDKFETIEYLDTGSITNNEIEGTQNLSLFQDEIPSRAKRKVKHDDILFSTVRPNLRHFGILKNPGKNMIASTGFAVLSPNHQEIFSELLYLFITSEENLKSLQARAEMSVSTYPSINAEDILNMDFVFPDREILVKAKRIFVSIFQLSDSKKKENRALKPFVNLLLSKLATIGSPTPAPAAPQPAQLTLAFA